MDQDYYEGTDFLSPVPADGERTEEFEYEVRIAHDITDNYSLTDLLAWPILLVNLGLSLIYMDTFVGRYKIFILNDQTNFSLDL